MSWTGLVAIVFLPVLTADGTNTIQTLIDAMPEDHGGISRSGSGIGRLIRYIKILESKRRKNQETMENLQSKIKELRHTYLKTSGLTDHEMELHAKIDDFHEYWQGLLKDAKAKIRRKMKDHEERTKADWMRKIEDEKRVVKTDQVAAIEKEYRKTMSKLAKEVDGYTSFRDDAVEKLNSKMDEEIERVSEAAAANLTEQKRLTPGKIEELRSELIEFVNNSTRESDKIKKQSIYGAEEKTKLDLTSKLDEKYDEVTKTMSKQKEELQKEIEDGDDVAKDLTAPVEDLLRHRYECQTPKKWIKYPCATMPLRKKLQIRVPLRFGCFYSEYSKDYYCWRQGWVSTTDWCWGKVNDEYIKCKKGQHLECEKPTMVCF